jgi:hypothetical protein
MNSPNESSSANTILGRIPGRRRPFLDIDIDGRLILR